MRRAFSTLMLSFLIAVAGCSSYVDFRRPIIRNYARDAFYKPPTLAEETEVAPQPPESIAEALARWQEMAGKPKEEYVVEPGDAVRVSVLVPTQPGAGSFVELPVSEDGDVTLSLIGKVEVAGLTAGEIEERLIGLYADGYYRDPVVRVVVTGYASKQIIVTGAVAAPRIVVLKANRITLLEALLEAGGLAEEAGETARVTRAAPPGGADEAGPEVVEVDLDRLMAGADMHQNVWLLPGDMVYVAPAAARTFFYVLGYVRAPGAYPLPADGSTLGMLEAVAFARGLGPAGRADRTYLLRTMPGGEEVHRVDLTRVAAAKDLDIVVQPGDTIIVGTSWGRRTMDGILHAMGLRSLAPRMY